MKEAASVPLVALTVWQVLVEPARLQAGLKILIHAGSGGVGTIAIQLAKHFGAIVATTASAANADLVRSLGADVVIDYKTQDFSTILSGYDVVLNSLDAKTLEASLKVLKPGGKLISISGPPDPAFARTQGLMGHGAIPIIGPRTLEQAQSNIGAVDVSLSSEQFARLDTANVIIADR